MRFSPRPPCASTSRCSRLFVPLSLGGRIVLAESPLDWAAVPGWGNVTLINTVPSAIAAHLRTAGIPAGVRTINIAGEPLDGSMVQQIYRLSPAARVLNLYGPSEDTTYSTCAVIDRDEDGPPPIGRPIASKRVYLLDPHLALVPIGVPGEVCLSGAGLARGYFDRPDLTAASFLPDPFGGTPGQRLYRTGDLARYRADGELDFLGRLDRQIKLRGYRIELGEVESALEQHPAVREAVVVAREGPEGDKRLAAYVVPRREPAPTGPELRRHLTARLPDPMIPATYTVVGELPRTPSGKVDRLALPRPETARPALREAYVAPRTATEERLASIWSEVLGIERPGVEDNFFALGGHSLAAIRVLSRVNSFLQVEVPLRKLFEAPRIAALAQEIEARLSAVRRAALLPPLRSVPRQETMPLSHAQLRLWFLDRLEPGNPAYNIALAERLVGRIDTEALERSLLDLVRRHEVLRTRYTTVEGRPVQIVEERPHLALRLVDLRGLGPNEGEHCVARWGAAEARAPFDLEKGGLLRVSLLRLADDVHVLLVTMHHIVSDGWSFGLFWSELAEGYAARCQGRDPDLPSLPVQYLDFAAWQREWLQGSLLEEQIAYWRRRLQGAPDLLALPTDRPRRRVRSFSGASCAQRLPLDLSQALRALSQAHGGTLFITLLAAFKVLLARLSGQVDILVGTPVAARTRPETEGLIGCFLNTLVLRTDLGGAPSFAEAVRRVRDTALEAYKNEDVPFERLLEDLRPKRDLSRTPLFQVFFNMLNLPGSRPRLLGLEAELQSFGESRSNFDLTVYIADEDMIGLAWVYSADLFDAARVEEMTRQYESLLAQVVEDPSRSIASLALRTPNAASRLPDPTEPLSADWLGPVHEQFAAQARRVPERAAVVSEQGTWRYAELERRSNQLAQWLRAAGVKRGDVVGIYAQRGAALAWAVMGALKAGAAFWILDPTHPPARLVSCLRLVRPRAWLKCDGADEPPREILDFLHEEGCVGPRLTLPGAPTIPVDPLDAQPVEAPIVEAGPDDLACVVFTSGSTGVPKGVLGRHGPLSHFLPWLRRSFDLSESDRFSMLSSLSHDPLQRDLFTPLQVGATICIPPPATLASPRDLYDWMRTESITVSHITPAMSHLLGEAVRPHEGDHDRPSSLRWAIFLGDALRRVDVVRMERLFPGVRCAGFYGTTETQRAVGCHLVPPASLRPRDEEPDQVRTVLPLGTGIDDVQLLVVDGENRPAGVGEVGEICVRSPHLARGYLGDESLTRRRFEVSPFTGLDGDRIYRTGDLGRFRTDGAVEFLGRADQQVKIRGFRVEIAEVEGALSAHPAVREAAVVVRSYPEEALLVAYFAAEGSLSTLALRAFLRAQLPDYMIPTWFVQMEALPRTSSGKFDRSALPVPEGAASHAGEPVVAPRTPVERALLEIWQAELGKVTIGVHDNFFDLGGHSLQSIVVIERVERSLGVRLRPRDLFLQTLEQLAAACERAGACAARES